MLLCLCTCLACTDDDDIVATAQPYEIPDGCIPDIEKATVVVIDSDKALTQAFGDNAKKLKQVDFRHYRLLLVTDVSTSGITKIDKKLTETDDGYAISINIGKNLTAVMQPWAIAYLVPSCTCVYDIRLTITYNAGGIGEAE